MVASDLRDEERRCRRSTRGPTWGRVRSRRATPRRRRPTRASAPRSSCTGVGRDRREADGEEPVDLPGGCTGSSTSSVSTASPCAATVPSSTTWRAAACSPRARSTRPCWRRLSPTSVGRCRGPVWLQSDTPASRSRSGSPRSTTSGRTSSSASLHRGSGRHARGQAPRAVRGRRRGGVLRHGHRRRRRSPRRLALRVRGARGDVGSGGDQGGRA